MTRHFIFRLVSAAYLGFLILLTLKNGVFSTGDCEQYFTYANILIEHHFDPVGFYTGDLPKTSLPVWLYFFHIYVTAILVLVLGEGWATGMVGLNIIILASLCYRIMSIIDRPKSSLSLIVAVAAGLMFFVSAELSTFSRFAMSDILFIGLLFILAEVLGRLSQFRGSRIAIPALLTILVAFYRPAFAPVFAACAVCAVPILVWIPKQVSILKSGGWKPRVHLWLFAALFGGLAIAYPIAVYVIYLKGIQTPIPVDSGKIMDTLNYIYKHGWVVHDRPSTYHLPPENFFDNLWLSYDRFLHYFMPFNTEFSLLHNVVNGLFFLPLYSGISVLVFFAIFRKQELPEPDYLTLVPHIAIVICFSLFHGVTHIDYDWRYRLSVIPSLILLGSFGMRILANGVLNWRIHAKV